MHNFCPLLANDRKCQNPFGDQVNCLSALFSQLLDNSCSEFISIRHAAHCKTTFATYLPIDIAFLSVPLSIGSFELFHQILV